MIRPLPRTKTGGLQKLRYALQLETGTQPPPRLLAPNPKPNPHPQAHPKPNPHPQPSPYLALTLTRDAHLRATHEPQRAATLKRPEVHREHHTQAMGLHGHTAAHSVQGARQEQEAAAAGWLRSEAACRSEEEAIA